MFYYFLRRYAIGTIELQHSLHQIQELFIVIETIALIFLKRLWYILENLLLLDQDALTLSPLDTQQSLA